MLLPFNWLGQLVLALGNGTVWPEAQRGPPRSARAGHLLVGMQAEMCEQAARFLHCRFVREERFQTD